jgi:uncharacterized glyoxalase superfamily protein PhnB
METKEINMKRPIPIFRMFDEEKAKDFYINFLEFKLDWEHRFEADFPLYMQVSFGECTIHLSEHHGDCSPGGAIRIEVSDITAYHEKLLAKKYKFARPGLEETPWNTKEVKVGDPFGNKVVFYEFNKE